MLFRFGKSSSLEISDLSRFAQFSSESLAVLAKTLRCTSCGRFFLKNLEKCRCGLVNLKGRPSGYYTNEKNADLVLNLVQKEFKAAGERLRQRVRRQLGKIGPFFEVELWKIQKGRCYYCMLSLNDKGRNRYHVDHLKSVAAGGKSLFLNSVLACKRCNLWKNWRGELEFVEIMRDRLLDQWNLCRQLKLMASKYPKGTTIVPLIDFWNLYNEIRFSGNTVQNYRLKTAMDDLKLKIDAFLAVKKNKKFWFFSDDSFWDFFSKSGILSPAKIKSWLSARARFVSRVRMAKRKYFETCVISEGVDQ